MKPNLLKSRRQETLLFAALCFCIAASTNAECPVPVDRQGYITEIVQKLTFDLAFVGINVHDLVGGLRYRSSGLTPDPWGNCCS
jgi:hypothetical protein